MRRFNFAKNFCLATIIAIVTTAAAYATEIRVQHSDGSITIASNNGPNGDWEIINQYHDGSTKSIGTKGSSWTTDEVARDLEDSGDTVTVDGAPYQNQKN